MSHIGRFVLGTAQMGMAYGINNVLGRPSFARAQDILEMAQMTGVETLDTADAYGESSEVLARADATRFKVLSKFSFTKEIPTFSKALENSLLRLQVAQLEGYSFHHFSDFLTFENWAEVILSKEKGLIKKLGVSVYSNEEFNIALNNPYIDLIQLPFNIFDNETRRGEPLKKAQANGKEIHARSIFLQGLLFMAPEKISGKLSVLRPSLEQLRSIAIEASLTIEELCVGYVLSKPVVRGLVIGLESVEQLEVNVKLFNRPALDANIVEELEKIRIPSIELLNPGNWK